MPRLSVPMRELILVREENRSTRRETLKIQERSNTGIHMSIHHTRLGSSAERHNALNMYLPILHFPRVDMRYKLQEKLHRVSGP